MVQKLGVAHYLLKNKVFVRFCIDFVNNVLNKNENIRWCQLGPNTISLLYIKYSSSSLILLNDYETVKKGCNFICWDENPGFNKQNWYLESENLAKLKADFLKNNGNCYYLITWTIYRNNDMGDNLNKMVFYDKNSVFSYFVNYKKLNKVPQTK